MSFEGELGAAKGKDAERKYVEKAGGAQKLDSAALQKLDNPGLSLESSQDERDRINRVRMQTAGNLNELRVSEEELQAQGIERGVNPVAGGENKQSAQEYFATGELHPDIESDTLTAMRMKDPAMALRYATLKRDRVSRQADIINLKEQIASQKDEALKAAQMKVLAQFERELKTLENELEELGQGL